MRLFSKLRVVWVLLSVFGIFSGLGCSHGGNQGLGNDGPGHLGHDEDRLFTVAPPSPGRKIAKRELLTDDWRTQVYTARKTPEKRSEPIVEGYTDRLSYAPGDTVLFHVDSRGGRYRLQIARYGQKEEVVYTSSVLPGVTQITPKHAYKDGCGWTVTSSFVIPKKSSSWRSGMYSAKLSRLVSGAAESYMTFVVKGPETDRAEVLVLASTSTWNAYNAWGGMSVYRDYRSAEDKQDPNAGVATTLVHFERPNLEAAPIGNQGHLASGELHVLRWLEREGYRYDMIAEMDLHQNPGLLQKYKVVVLNTHPEYYSAEMFDGLEQFVQAGGKLINLSGNGVYAKVTFQGNQMETYRAIEGGGRHTHDGSTGGLWTALGRSEASVLGSRFMGMPKMPAAPYVVRRADHWVFAGTGLKNGDRIGRRGLNRENGGASGWEMDRIDPDLSPKGIVHLAKGDQGEKGADLTLYETATGGAGFSAASINFGGSLVVDPVLTRIMRNVLDRFLGEP